MEPGSPSFQIIKPVEHKSALSDKNCEPKRAFLPKVPPELLLEITRHVLFPGGQPPVVRGRPVLQSGYNRSHAQDALSLLLTSKQMNEMASFLVQKAFDSGVTLHVVLGDETSEELCRSFLAKNGPRGWVRKLRVNIEVKSIRTLYSIDNSCTLPRPRLRVGPAVRQMVRSGRLKELKIVVGPDPKGIFDSWPLTLGAFLQNALGFGLMWLSESSLDSLRIWTVSKDHIRVHGLCDHHAAKPGGCGEGSDQDTLQIETEPVGSAYAGDDLLEVDWRPMYGLPPRRTGNGTGT